MANQKISARAAITTPVAADEFPIGVAAGGPLDRKVTFANLKAAILAAVYPVGSFYISKSVATSPATLLGFGTWAAVVDKVLVGVGSAPFNTPGASVGAATVACAGAVGGHTHTVTSNVAVAAHGEITVDSDATAPVDVLISAGGGGAHGVTNNAVTSGSTTPSFTPSATSVVQPSLVVYMWERTA
ncbi:MAG: hypothetical protein H7062_22340 [Candidatus Saccharimonas sp.]|nr:hypothetical protein [Planctomycetaceae bacterium]